MLGKGVSLCRGERRSSAGKVLWGGGECIAQPAGVCRGCVGERKCSGRACRCAGASEGLRRGMGCEVGGECIAQPAGVRRCAGAGEGLRRGMGREDDGNASRSRRACVGTAWACVGAAWGSGSAREGCVAVQGRAEVFGGEWVVRSAGMHRALRACVGAAWGSGSAREGRVAVRGRAEVFGGEWVVRSAGLTHIRRSSSRARVLLLYVRRATAVKSRPWGRKTPPASTHRPRRLPHSPRPRSHFRVRVHTAPAYPSAAPTKTLASRSSSYPQWVIHGKVIHIVARRPVQNVLALAPAHANI